MSLKDTKIVIKEDGGSSSTLKKKKKKEEEKAVAVIKDDNASRLREVARDSVTKGVANRDSAQTGNRTQSYAESREPTPTTTSWSPSLKRDALAAPDYSSPTAAWRNPETFQAIPWSDYEGLNKYDRKAYLKAYAENSQREKAQRDAMAQAEAQRIKQEESDKMLTDHFYSRILKGEQIDVSNFDTKTLQNLQQRAYEDYSNGNLSIEKYLLMPIHKFESLDNGQAKVYNGSSLQNLTYDVPQKETFWDKTASFFSDIGHSIGDFATQAYQAYEQGSTRRYKEMVDEPSLYTVSNWLSNGFVENTTNGLTSRSQAVLEDPNLYTVSNWLTLGTVDTFNGAFKPAEPFSLQHWADSFGAALILFPIINKTVSVGKSAIKGAFTVSPKGTFISADDAIRIQNAANKTGQRIVVVGSRANGTATPLSDWDYYLTGNSAKRHSAVSSLPRGISGGQNNTGIDVFVGYPNSPSYNPLNEKLPYIIFDPKE